MRRTAYTDLFEKTIGPNLYRIIRFVWFKLLFMSSTGLLTINTLAIANNWRLLQDRMLRVNAAARCAAVVKADAYGLGVKPVAIRLYEAGCREFFVATLNEAIELREHLGDEPMIFVFGGLHHGCGEEWCHYDLIPVIIDLAHVETWKKYSHRHGKALPWVLKVDTGMHRLGVQHGELKQWLYGDWFNLGLKYLLSHLACADTPEHPLNLEQHKKFLEVLSLIQAQCPEVAASLANSSGLFLGGAYCFDLGRPGIALYGGNPIPYQQNPMQAVVELELPVMQCRTIAAGESVGYGASFIAQRETRLVTVFGGYADGLMRVLGNQATAFWKGFSVPMVGRVSMDALMFDVSDLIEWPTTLTILNQTQTVDDLAGAAKTIGYEVLTSLGKRYQRNYL